ncbi:hypothetical protein C5167_044039 [Papaver somniferum]|uniref:Uncharacterized protein n=1 Tax=Papaver somniferum TaxID=3469 RepID=A0A4Y7L8D0_PAPSO|nr:hypothetical protein C5167_044039 [Papaver somniferum]
MEKRCKYNKRQGYFGVYSLKVPGRGKNVIYNTKDRDKETSDMRGRKRAVSKDKEVKQAILCADNKMKYIESNFEEYATDDF